MFLRASLLRPKRPTGLIRRPVYQAGLMSGAGGEQRELSQTHGACRVRPGLPPGPGQGPVHTRMLSSRRPRRPG